MPMISYRESGELHPGEISSQQCNRFIIFEINPLGRGVWGAKDVGRDPSIME